jgi:hypothetical protein
LHGFSSKLHGYGLKLHSYQKDSGRQFYIQDFFFTLQSIIPPLPKITSKQNKVPIKAFTGAVKLKR